VQFNRTYYFYACEPCRRRYPVVCGIPDFRLHPDRYLSIEDDRDKGSLFWEQSGRMSFAELLDLYYAITPEIPGKLAAKFKAHALAEVEIAEATLDELNARPVGALLDVGCSTGGLVVAAARRGFPVVGVDAALRWLVIGKQRLKEARVETAMVCANAEHLPFSADTFAALTAVDLLEHVVDPVVVLGECRRVAAPGALCYFAANNRHSLVSEPHTGVWGVGWLPRRFQAAYVRLWSGRAYRNITLPSGGELVRGTSQAGFSDCRLEAAPLSRPGRLERALRTYNRLRRSSGVSALLRWMGPRIQLTCRK
jgi:ubiquinone/menaquinone biosynthesis C-methylase UbiE